MAIEASNTLPNFLIIGVQKAGTTSIYTYLKQHPQIYMSPVKETNFFGRDWELATPEERDKKRNGINTLEKYAKLFDSVKDEIAIGEASPNYMFYPHETVQCIKKYVPNAKLIAILRNPAERAHSDYLMHVRDAIGKGIPLSEQIREHHKSFTIRKGYYYKQLKPFIDEFGTDQVKVYLYEDLCKDPATLMQETYRFLGVDDTFCPDVSKRLQAAQMPKVKAVNQVLQGKNPIRKFVASLLQPLVPFSTRQKIRKTLINLNSETDRQKMRLSLEDRRKLVDLYRDDILQLQDLIKRDLSSWLEVGDHPSKQSTQPKVEAYSKSA